MGSPKGGVPPEGEGGGDKAGVPRRGQKEAALNTLIYHRVKHATSHLQGKTLTVSVSEEGDLFSGEVELVLDLEARRILSAQGRVAHCLDPACRHSLTALERVAGLSLASEGLRRVKEALDEEKTCPLLARLLLDGCRVTDGLAYSPVAQSPIHEARIAGIYDEEEYQARLAEKREFWDTCVVWAPGGSFRRAWARRKGRGS